MAERKDDREVRQILAEVKQLAVRYYKLTKKPLGVTGEVAEYIAAEKLGLKLENARTPGYDATRLSNGRKQCIQIKARAYPKDSKRSQKIGTIKSDGRCDFVLLVLLDNKTLDPIEMWEAPMAAVRMRLFEGKSNAHARGALSVSEFKKHCKAEKVWPLEEKATKPRSRRVKRGVKRPFSTVARRRARGR